MKNLLTIALLTTALHCQAQIEKLVVGTYTTGKSEGIYRYDFDATTGEAKMVSSINSSNPSYLAVSPDQQYLYAVNEDADSLNNGGMISAYRFDKSKKHLQFINQQPSGGNHPCYITVDHTGKWVITANYTGGSFSITPLNTDGSLAGGKKVVQHEGSSVNAERQEKAHVHQTLLSSDNKKIFVADLGMDKFFVYGLDAGNGSVKEMSAVSVSAGSGPRHAAIHPGGKYIYLTEELSGTVAVFRLAKGGDEPTLLQTISAVPADYKGMLSGADAHVSPDGRFLYTSNRGDCNNIAIFKIDAATGLLTNVGFQSSGGIKPRNFNFDPSGKYLLVANQESDSIHVLRVDHQTGLLTDTGKTIEVPNPVCVTWVK